MRRVRLLPGILLVILLLATPRAAGPRFWTTATAADFLAGRSEGVYVSLDGVVTAGPRLTSRLSNASPAQIWSLARAADGTLWAGTGGGEGRVVRLRSGQPDDTVFTADESNVFAVATAGGQVYAATSPDGRVVAIGADGATRTVFDPEEKYIWALATDSEGRLWVGAGTPAVVYRVETDGSAEAVYHPPADHVVALAVDDRGRMLAGTESPGRLYRFDGDRPFVLLESGLTELRAVTVTRDGTVYAAAVDRGSDGPEDGETTSVAAIVASSSPSSGGGDSDTASSNGNRSAVFRIDPDGQWERVWRSPDVVYDLIAPADGGVLAATGPAGRLYRITDDREVLLYTGVDARQITRFGGLDGDGRLAAFATSNPGRILEIGEGLESPAVYLSDVRDTNSVSTWGLLRWEGQGNVALFTRSGNTEEPDDSWSPWSDAYRTASGAAVTSPAARYVQWKAELTPAGSASPTLTAVTLAFLPRNSRPAVASVTLQAPGVVFQRPFASDDTAIAGLDDAVAEARRLPGDPGPPEPTPSRRMFRKGLQTIQWSASDADDDPLRYSLQYRRDGDPEWHDLRRDLLGTIYVWDTTSMADGRYVVRVVASDAAANPNGRALSGERESGPITIDNTPPAVSTTAAGTRITVTVEDAMSPIQRVEYSLRGGPWEMIYPADGLADSLQERYEIVVDAADDAADLIVRATDALQNVTSRAAGG